MVKFPLVIAPNVPLVVGLPTSKGVTPFPPCWRVMLPPVFPPAVEMLVGTPLLSKVPVARKKLCVLISRLPPLIPPWLLIEVTWMSPEGSRVTLPPLPLVPLESICPAVIWVLASTRIFPPSRIPDEFRLPVAIAPVLQVRVILPPDPEFPVELEFTSAVMMLPGAKREIVPPVPEFELAFKFPALVLIVPVVLLRLMFPAVPELLVLEFRLLVIMLPAAVRDISCPVVPRLPLLMFPESLLRVMLPPLVLMSLAIMLLLAVMLTVPLEVTGPFKLIGPAPVLLFCT